MDKCTRSDRSKIRSIIIGCIIGFGFLLIIVLVKLCLTYFRNYPIAAVDPNSSNQVISPNGENASVNSNLNHTSENLNEGSLPHIDHDG